MDCWGGETELDQEQATEATSIPETFVDFARIERLGEVTSIVAYRLIDGQERPVARAIMPRSGFFRSLLEAMKLALPGSMRPASH